jgi:hypothetical protein
VGIKQGVPIQGVDVAKPDTVGIFYNDLARLDK